MSDRALPFTVSLDWSTVIWVKQHRYALIVQTTERQAIKLTRFSLPVRRSQASLNRKPKSYLFTDTLVYTFAQWSVPPKLYVDFS